MDLNRVTLIGNLTGDPKAKSTPSGKSLTTFTLATSYRTEEQETVEFHDVSAWGKLADIIAQYVRKGSKVYVEGRMHSNLVEKDGKKRRYTEVVADNLIMLGHHGRREAKLVKPDGGDV